MVKTLQQFLLSFLKILLNNVEDLFFLAGLVVIIGTTYHHNPVIGNYLLGGILLLIGLLIAKRG